MKTNDTLSVYIVRRFSDKKWRFSIVMLDSQRGIEGVDLPLSNQKRINRINRVYKCFRMIQMV